MRALALACFGCAFVVAGAAPASEGVLWQGRTPEQGSALVAGSRWKLLGRSIRTCGSG